MTRAAGKIKQMPTQKCIYCLEDLEASRFDKEHVLPKALGKFKNNLTLIHCVCIECNKYFGENLDFFLARDSIEALRRLTHGVKPLKEIQDLHLERLSLRLAQEGEWKGVRMQLRVEGGELGVEAMPQVGLAKKGVHDRIYLTEQELENPATELPPGWDPDAGINVIAPSEAVAERLVTLLAKRGITGQRRVDLPWAEAERGRIWVEITSRIDGIIRRSVAKIAFNYMAKMSGADFVLHQDFNVTRSFIRHGVLPGYPLVVTSQRPILADDHPTRRQTEGHLITLNWTPSRRSVVGQVSLFNEITYIVSLARNFSGVWRPIRSGHHFDVSRRRITALGATSLTLPRAHSRRR